MTNNTEFSQFMGSQPTPQKSNFNFNLNPQTLIIIGFVLIVAGFFLLNTSDQQEMPLKGSITPEAVKEQIQAEKEALEKAKAEKEIEAQKLELEAQIKDLELQQAGLSDEIEQVGKEQGVK